ncbi:MAG: hypothetical protein GY953_53075 [bacterium]|nr:hypothetical protein [bacterium]
MPEKHKSERFPCHHIPLNQRGETVESLEQLGGRDNAEEQVKNWLRRAIQRPKDGEDVAMPSDVKF